MKRKLLTAVAAAATALCCAFGMTACGSGRSIESTAINANGELVITYTDGSTDNLGVVVGADGKNGTNGTNGTNGANGAAGAQGERGEKGDKGEDGVTPAFELKDGELYVSYDDGESWTSLGNVQGADGKDGAAGAAGATGATGATGVGIKDVTIDEDGNLVVTYTNGTSKTVGQIIFREDMVSTPEELQAQLNEGGDITLIDDIEVTSLSFAEGSTNIDLNGHALTLDSTATIALEDGKDVTFTGGTLVTTGIKSTNAIFNIKSGSSITVEDCTVESEGTVFYPQGDAAEVNIINSTITTTGVYCVGTNAATVENYNVVINIKDSTLTSNSADYDNCAVCINVAGTLNIDNSIITGDRQAVMVRAGTANITNSTLICTGNFGADNAEKYYTGNWSSGNEVPGGALVIGNRSTTAYKAAANVTLENSVLRADNGYAVVYIEGNANYTATLTHDGCVDADVIVAAEDNTIVTDTSVSDDGEGESEEDGD